MGEKVLRLQRNKKDTDLVPIQQLVSKILKQCTLKRFSQIIRGHIIDTNFFIHYSIRNKEISNGNVPCFVATRLTISN